MTGLELSQRGLNVFLPWCFCQIFIQYSAEFLNVMDMQNFAGFAQYFEICTCRLEHSWFPPIFLFSHIFFFFWGALLVFLAQFLVPLFKLKYWVRKTSTLKISAFLFYYSNNHCFLKLDSTLLKQSIESPAKGYFFFL